MVARYRGYFGTLFKGYYGVTRGGHLSPTIFNVVVDAVLRNWVTVLAVMEVTAEPRTDSLVWYIQRLAAYFYANKGLLKLIWENRLQQASDILTDIFDWVGICTNVFKTVIMTFQLCCAIGGHYVEAYGLRIMGY